MMSGEPGIGKTELANQLAAHALSSGVAVSWGRCWERSGAPSYWPWIQILRSLAEESGGETLRSLAGSEALAAALGRVAQIVPELGGHGFHPTFPTRAGSEESPFRMLDSIARLLRAFAQKHARLLIVDDLHDADEASLTLLRFVARELRDARLMMVGTYRTQEAPSGAALKETWANLLREARELQLPGLNLVDVGRMFELRAGAKPDSSFAAELHRATGGNPLFLDGILRMLGARGSLRTALRLDLSVIELPDGVREALRARIAMLPDAAIAPLRVAAAIGNEFSPDIVQSAAGSTDETVVDAIQAAREMGLVRIIASRPQRYEFAHALIRDALYETISPATRPRLHREIAEALERAYKRDPEAHAAELAHHFVEAARDGDRAKAIRYLVSAGDAAERVGAFADASSFWQTALELGAGEADAKSHADLLSRIGHNMLLTGSDRVSGTHLLDEAIRIYDQIGERIKAAGVRADLALQLAKDDDEHLTDVRRAEALLNEADETLQAPGTRGWFSFCMATMVAAWQRLDPKAGLACADQVTRRDAKGFRAEETAISALYMRPLYLVYNGQLEQAFITVRQAEPPAAGFGSPLPRLRVAENRGDLYWLLWDPQEAARSWEDALRIPEIRLAPLHRAAIAAKLGMAKAMLGEGERARGLLADAPRRVLSALCAFQAGQWEQATQILMSSVELARRTGSRVQEAECSYLLARTLRAGGDYRGARTVLDDVLASFGDGSLPTVEMWFRPEAAIVHCAMDDRNRAASELARCHAILASGENWRGLHGNVLRGEAVAGFAGRHSENADRFVRAVEVFRKYALPWEEADTLNCWASVLWEAGDRSGAKDKFTAARAIYQRVQAGPRWIEALERMSPEFPAKSPFYSASGQALFKKDGPYWTIAFADHDVKLRDSKGLRYIAHLLANPGVGFSVIELAGLNATSGEPLSMARDGLTVAAIGDDRGQPLLDDEAKSQFRSRMRELRRELEEAESFNDRGRVERTRSEIEAIEEHLRRAIGLHGRDRKSNSQAERMRWMVTKRIKADMRRISENAPALGRILDRTIKTGSICRYLPEADHPIVWVF